MFEHFASQNSGQTYDTASFYHKNQINSAHKDFSNLLNTTANKSSILGCDNLLSTSFEKPPQASNSQQRKTLSGQNALLSLMSQDDFQKIKQEIHNHIDKIGGKIEEIAASEEDERDDSVAAEDDDDVILTSFRERKVMSSGRNMDKVEDQESCN